jgi:hypothetical protein
MKKLDNETQRMIADAIERGVAKAVEKMKVYGEVWLTADKVVEQFGMISADFMKRNGKLLPREKIEWVDNDGVLHQGVWAYPRNRLQEMIASGELKCLGENL